MTPPPRLPLPASPTTRPWKNTAPTSPICASIWWWTTFPPKCRAWASSPLKATWSRPWSVRISTSPASLWIPCARTSKPPRKTRPTGSRWATTAPLPAASGKFAQLKHAELTEKLNLKSGCTVFVCAGKKLAAQKTAGVIRKTVGNAVEKYMDRERYEFCWIVDFPMYEIGEESGELEFCHNPFSMPQGGLKALWRGRSPLHQRLSVRSGLQRRGALLRRGA